MSRQRQQFFVARAVSLPPVTEEISSVLGKSTTVSFFKKVRHAKDISPLTVTVHFLQVPFPPQGWGTKYPYFAKRSLKRASPSKGISFVFPS
jgi:hypothetical protein